VTRAVVFDFNGTLSDDEPILCEIFVHLFAEHGKPLSAQEYFDELAGLSDPEIVRAWLGRDHPDVDAVIDERVQRYRAAVADGSSVHEHVREAVRYAAARVPVALVSGAARAEIEPVLAAAGLSSLFRGVVSSDDVIVGKPHPEAYLRALELFDGVDPDDVLVIEDTEAGIASARAAGIGRILAVTGTLDPQRLRGADELIDRLLERGVAVSLGHSDATAAQANHAFDRGARSVTHLFNAMRPFLHRDPGIVGAALSREDVVVSIILDGIHLAPETALTAWRAARGRLALVTDAITATMVSEGPSSLGELAVHVHEGTVRGPDGRLAGSVLTMIEALRNLLELGVPFEDAVAAATATPARVLGERDLGRLDVGLPADVVVLDDRAEIERVLVAGELQVAA
jgi:N-acetylglucosamine-6-phosphate deacetylase